MSKSKFWKILTITLSLCLILGAVIGITASASDEDGVITFDEDSYADYLTITTNANFAQDNTWSVEDVDGEKKLLVNKHGVDKSGKTYNGGVTFKVNKTYTEPNANLAVFEFDMNIDSATAYDNQFILGHQGQFSNNATPFLFSVTLRNLEQKKEHHIVVTYKVTATDENGVPVAYEATYSADGSEPYVVNKIHGKYLTANGGTYELPRVDQVDCMAFALNNSFYGDVYFDNFSLKLVHEHDYWGGVCSCGETLDGTVIPEIWSENVSYESKTYIYYAVPVDTIPEADKVEGGFWMNVNSYNGVHDFNKLPEAETKVIHGRECYIFKTNGVPAKELNTIEVVYVETASGIKSEKSYYSVEKYLYERLYDNGFAAKTAEDVGDDKLDYKRRTIYYDLLKYGAIAQELLAPDAKDKIGDTTYVAPSEYLKMDGGLIKAGTKVVLGYNGNGNDFMGWKYTSYDCFGEIIKEGYAADGSILEAEGYIYAEPVFLSDYYTEDMINAIDFDVADDASGIVNSIDKLDGAPVATAGWDEATQSYLVTKTGKKGYTAKLFSAPTTTVAGASSVVFEADLTYNAAADSGKMEIFLYFGPKDYTNNNLMNRFYIVGANAGDGQAIKLDREYTYFSSTNDYNYINKAFGVKTGDTFNLKMVYSEGAFGEASTSIFVNDVYIHTTRYFCGYNYNKGTSNPIDAANMIEPKINLAYNTTGTLKIDNISLTQTTMPTFECVGIDDISVIDFDYKADKYTPSVSSTNTWSVVTDKVTGNTHFELHKTKDVSGASVQTNVTKTEVNANLMVFEGDIYIPSGSAVNLQINAGHKHTSGGNGNTQTPFLLTANTNLRDQWVRIRVEYQALEVDADGKATLVCTRIYENGKLMGSNDPSNKLSGWNLTASNHTTGGSYNKATSINQIPLPSEMMNLRIACNQSHNGTVMFDNLSLKLLHVEGCDPVKASAE